MPRIDRANLAQQVKQRRLYLPSGSLALKPATESGIKQSVIQRSLLNSGLLSPTEIKQLQSTVGNRTLGRLLSRREAEPFRTSNLHKPGNRVARNDRDAIARSVFTQGPTIQCLGESLDTPAKVEPAHGEDKKEQRRYSVDQYVNMWEAEQGRKLTPDERETIERGCIGITALNLSGGGDPPLNECYSTFGRAKASVDMKNREIDQFNRWMESIPSIAHLMKKDRHAILFAKMFWSNQNPNEAKRRVGKKKAFRPDKHGKVDMTGYKYFARPGFVNFDYAFWDEASQSFWHANHSEPDMEVKQSTKAKFEEGFADFDRTVYCVAIAGNYDPGKAVVSHK